MIPKSYHRQISTVHFKKPLTTTVKIQNQAIRNNRKLGPVQQIDPSFCSNALRLSAKKGFNLVGKQIHSLVIKLGYYSLSWLQHQLLDCYVKSKIFSDACKLFDEMLVRNVVTWNTLIHGSQLGLHYFRRMLLEGFKPDHVTFSSLFRLSTQVREIEIGRQLHCGIIKWGFCKDCYVNSSLVDLYAKFGFVREARLLFDDVLEKDLVLWNVILSCYTLNRLAKDGLRVFSLMRLEGIKGDEYTFTGLLNCCASLRYSELGKQVHGLVTRFGFDRDVVVASALIDMYAKNENIIHARRMFDETSPRNAITWTTMIVGYGQYSDGTEATKLFMEMLREDFCPDEITLASVISSCGNISLNGEITQLHAYASKNGSLSFTSVSNALVNAYSKSGSMASAYKSFRSINRPDLVSYTSMIQAYAFHGLSRKAIELFTEVMSNGAPRPDRIMFLGVLTACSHGGLVNEGLRYFDSMTKDYQLVPELEHYNCLIDLLGRAGRLNEAFSMIKSMPIAPGADTLGAFIGACKVHNNVELAKWAAKELFVLEPTKNVNYALMSNTFAYSGRWFDVAMVRKMMRDNCCFKAPGSSWLEIAGEVHAFVSKDESHPQSLEVYHVLELLYKTMAQNLLSIS